MSADFFRVLGTEPFLGRTVVTEERARRVRIDETRNQVRVFNKEAATGAQNKKVVKKANLAADKRLQENLRRNEEIRHKGDEARVKRNLAKLKKTMKPGEVARGKKILEATKARDVPSCRSVC